MAKITYLEDQRIETFAICGRYATVGADVRCTYSRIGDGQAGYTTIQGQDYYVERDAQYGEWRIIEEAKGG